MDTISPPNEQKNDSVTRPGISHETLKSLGIRRVTAEEAKALVGKECAGTYIPYPKVIDNGKAYGRLRLDQPSGGAKYHQERGTSQHTYCLPGLRLIDGDLLVVEGEFKAIALYEAEFPAVGLSGFYSWGIKDESEPQKIKLEIQFGETLKRLKPRRIVFIGDPDTATNFQFSDAVAKMLESVALPVALLRIDYDERDGKGVDDIREKIGPHAFKTWFAERLRTAEEIALGTDKSVILKKLLMREEQVISHLTGVARERSIDRISKLGAYLRKDELNWLGEFAKRVLGLNKADFRASVQAKRESEATAKAARAAASGYSAQSAILKDFIMVGANYYGFSVDPATRKRSLTLTPCHREFVVHSLVSAGYTKSDPSHIPNLSLLQAGLWELHQTRCRAVTELLFRPYGRVVQPDGTTVFNNSRVLPLEPIGEITGIKDARITFTMRWLRQLFEDWPQLSHFLSVISYAYRNARAHAPKKPLAVFLVGPTDSGKSLLIDYWLPKIFGQDAAGDSYRLLKGENGASSVLKYYVCKLSDKDLGNDADVKRTRTGMLSLLADYTTGGKLMYENVTVEEVINLFAFSSNLDGSVVNLLRDMPSSILSKLGVYLCGKGLRGLSPGTGVAEFVSNPAPTLLKELPAFCALLEKWNVLQAGAANAYFDPRFGVKAYFNHKITPLLSGSHDETAVYEALLEVDVDRKVATHIYQTVLSRNPALSQIRLHKFTDVLRGLSKSQPNLVTMKAYGKMGTIKNSFYTVTGTAHRKSIEETADDTVDNTEEKPSRTQSIEDGLE